MLAPEVLKKPAVTDDEDSVLPALHLCLNGYEQSEA